MNRDEQLRQTADRILNAFRSGTLPPALAQMLVRPTGRHVSQVPSLAWSPLNRLIALLYGGHVLAAGYRQWQKLGRQVSKGESAFPILLPCFVKKDDPTPEDSEAFRRILVGFKAVPVFGYSQTEGESLDVELKADFLASLPLLEVAKRWGLDVGALPHLSPDSPLGLFSPGVKRPLIRLSTENLSTWAHELVHAADHRRGTLDKSTPASHAASETVAELGGAILLEALGYTTESDRGGAWEYLSAYHETGPEAVLSACSRLLDRTLGCVRSILDEAERMAAGAERTEGGFADA